MKTLKDWQNSGAKININHYRYSTKKQAYLPLSFFRITKTQDQISASGGITTVVIRDKDGNMFQGVANCNLKDAYRSRLGVQMALNRLKKVN